jgi:hypothetical protein
MKAIRTAIINHNDSEIKTRVKLNLVKEDDLYTWKTDDGEDCNTGSYKSVSEAENAARIAWGAECWGLKATWK